MSVPLLESFRSQTAQAGRLKRDVDIGTHRNLRALKTFGRDSDHRHRMPVQVDGLAQDAWIGAEFFAPARMVQYPYGQKTRSA